MAEVLLPQNWFARTAIEVAPDLIGCTLARRCADGRIFRGVIVEAEAYLQTDPACHAFKGMSKRNEVMFGPAGFSYVYLIYGIHHCINVVTGLEGVGEAVLIRALDLSSQGLDIRVAAGPGLLCKFLGINTAENGLPYFEPTSPLNIYKNTTDIPKALVQTTRLGITKAADYKWRWYMAGNKAVSKP